MRLGLGVPIRGLADVASVITGDLKPHTRQLYNNLIEGHRASLAQAITLVESTLKESKQESAKLLTILTKSSNHLTAQNTFRIGLTGPPGAGKSTFIETFGTRLTEEGHRVAVLAVDPSSSRRGGGSLLGDKTRMTELSRNPNAFIRPSPSRGHLGGVARTTNESILLCEAGGYDIIIVETVGVGQSEHIVTDMVDALCLILSPGGGDELQGIKRGIIEQCDLVLINKCDGDLIPAANRTKAEYTSALKFIQPKCSLWRTKVMKMSSRTLEGVDEVWSTLQDFKQTMIGGHEFGRRRAEQQKAWLWHYINQRLLEVASWMHFQLEYVALNLQRFRPSCSTKVFSKSGHHLRDW